MTGLLASLTALILMGIHPSAVITDFSADELPECLVITHCVRENWDVSDVESSFKKAVKAVAATPRTTIVEQTNSYVHAEAQTRWMRYTDDLLLKALPEKGLIQIRSESRVGIGDNGVNQQRVKQLAKGLEINKNN